jgi:hypothetical protein
LANPAELDGWAQPAPNRCQNGAASKKGREFQKSRVLRGMREAEEWEEGGNCSVREKPVLLAELPWNKAILI